MMRFALSNRANFMFKMLSIPPCQELQLVINVVYEPSIGRDTHRELYSQCRVSRNIFIQSRVSRNIFIESRVSRKIFIQSRVGKKIYSQ